MSADAKNWRHLLALAERVVQEVLESLPPALRGPATEVPVILEDRPDADLLDGEPTEDLLGLFSGTPFPDQEQGGDLFPAEIRLFLAGLWEEAEGRDEVYREEVRRTLLHELGHYLGLDEDDLFDRDLD